MSIYKIYKITNAVNGKVYIGQTKGSIRSRFTQHCRPDNPCVALRNAVSQVAYGKTPTAHNLHFFFVDVNGKPIVNISILKKRTKYCPVLCVETGVVYNSPKEASKKTGIYKECIFQSIRKGCYGGGYHWKKVNKGVVRVDI